MGGVMGGIVRETGPRSEQRSEQRARHVAELLAVLQGQRTALNELLEVADRQQSAIMERDREAIEVTTREQDKLFAELQALEHDREQVQRALEREVVASVPESASDDRAGGDPAAGPGGGLGSGADDGSGSGPGGGSGTGAGEGSIAGFGGDLGLNFDRLLQALPAGDRVMLTAARDEARRLLATLSSVNRANQNLLAQELALFDMYMSVLNPDMSAEAYSDPGQMRRGAHSAAVAFDTRA